MKVRHRTHGTVVAVPEHLATWTPDRNPHDPVAAALGKSTPIPWFQWAQWEQVPEDTPLTPPPAKPVDAPKPVQAPAPVEVPAPVDTDKRK